MKFPRDAAGRFSKGTFTASQTGAKALASNQYRDYVEKSTKSGVKGIGERSPSQDEMEDMIKKGGK